MTKPLPAFDELTRMAKEDPESLEQLRHDFSRMIIDSAPEPMQRRLEGLQFQIDMHIRKSKTPLASCIKISKLMHDNLALLHDTLQSSFTNTPDENKRFMAMPKTKEEIESLASEKETAKVLPFQTQAVKA